MDRWPFVAETYYYNCRMLGGTLEANGLFVSLFAFGWGISKFVQGKQMLSRCATNIAVATAVYMEQQELTTVGVLTPRAIQVAGDEWWRNSTCRSTEVWNPLVGDNGSIPGEIAPTSDGFILTAPGVGSINFVQDIDNDALVVTVQQSVKGFLFNEWTPTDVTEIGIAY
ncbi:MAG: hypothetical protein EB168_09520, partial [Euryarchaeota archaeon]|nr:hypothetical protein [Euryarchaeota archaeon]